MTDAHCHFFSERFFGTLAGESADRFGDARSVVQALGWDPPGNAGELAERWREELDRYGVDRAVLIASVPGDERSVAEAVARHPRRFVGFFMVNPTAEDAVARTEEALRTMGLRGACLFPAMHRYSVHDPRSQAVIEVVRQCRGVLFVHCGVLSVGVRTKLGLANRFDLRFGNPLDLHAVASAFADLPIVVPHFGAGLFREALMLADTCPNVYLDTSSSNGWIRYHPRLTLADTFKQAVAVAGASRLLFGTDSSFFPRGWQPGILTAQREAMVEAQLSESDRELILHGNFTRLFPPA